MESNASISITILPTLEKADVLTRTEDLGTLDSLAFLFFKTGVLSKLCICGNLDFCDLSYLTKCGIGMNEIIFSFQLNNNMLLSMLIDAFFVKV